MLPYMLSYMLSYAFLHAFLCFAMISYGFLRFSTFFYARNAWHALHARLVWAKLRVVSITLTHGFLFSPFSESVRHTGLSVSCERHRAYTYYAHTHTCVSLFFSLCFLFGTRFSLPSCRRRMEIYYSNTPHIYVSPLSSRLCVRADRDISLSSVLGRINTCLSPLWINTWLSPLC